MIYFNNILVYLSPIWFGIFVLSMDYCELQAKTTLIWVFPNSFRKNSIIYEVKKVLTRLIISYINANNFSFCMNARDILPTANIRGFRGTISFWSYSCSGVSIPIPARGYCKNFIISPQNSFHKGPGTRDQRPWGTPTGKDQGPETRGAQGKDQGLVNRDHLCTWAATTNTTATNTARLQRKIWSDHTIVIAVKLSFPAFLKSLIFVGQWSRSPFNMRCLKEMDNTKWWK